ncbi:hypothetical protein A4R43_36790 [Amycolatopsis albispora]|uniref:Uncharacterized protein n=1 Tax=Amycolatopsis albispora TaxID=1804986 RepID=A0A344LH05_9PSEU|nr:hypothetical protein A4R43_36790 [Amycolatopsis albispora]
MIYARVSTEKQAGEEQTSIPDQLRRGREVCTVQGWDLVDEYVDPGVSGEALEERPEMMRLLHDAQLGRMDVVVAIDLRRIGREDFVFAQIFRALDTAEVWVHADGQLYDPENNTQRLMRGISAVVSSHDRRELLRKMANGQRARALVGGWPGGIPPYGRRLVWPGTSEGVRPKAVVELDPTEVEIVLTATELLVDGDGSGAVLSTGDVARRLNALGYRTRGGSGRPGSRVPQLWTADTVQWMLRNRALLGEVIWGKPGKPGRQRQRESRVRRTQVRRDGSPIYGEPIRMQLEPILTEQRFQQLQVALDRSAISHRSPNRVYPLSGAQTVCGNTLGGFYRNDRRNGRNYVCSNRKRPRPNEPKCSCVYLLADTLEAAVWAEVTALLSDRARLEQMAADFAALSERQAPDAGRRLAEVQRRAQRLEEAKVTQVADAMKAGLEMKLVAEAVARIEVELKDLQVEQARLQAAAQGEAAVRAQVATVGQLADHAAARLPQLGLADQHRVLQLLGAKITLMDQSKQPRLRIEGYLPELPQVDGPFLTRPVTHSR